MTESLWFMDALMRIHLSPEATGGRFALIEALAPPGHMPPRHVHEADDEAFFVLEGELTVHADGVSTVHRPGDSGYVPAGTAHTIEITSSGPARALLLAVPPSFVGFLRACSVPAQRLALPSAVHRPPLPELLAAAAEHGMRLLDAPEVPSDRSLTVPTQSDPVHAPDQAADGGQEI